MSNTNSIEWYPRLAGKYHVPLRVIEILAELIQRTNSEEARFDIPELGGKGIWKQGQGAHIGNGFNDALNQRATELCNEIAALVRTIDRDETTILQSLDETIAMTPVPSKSASTSLWWPEHLGKNPDLLGNAGTIRYAYFAEKNRLVLQSNLRNRLFDTTGHQITSVMAGRSAGFFNTIIKTESQQITITNFKEVSK